MSGELTPQEVLADLLGSGDFPAEVLDPEAAAEIILRRLKDAGFEVVAAGERQEAGRLVIAAARRWRSVEAGESVAKVCDELCDAVDALYRAEAGYTIVPTARNGK